MRKRHFTLTPDENEGDLLNLTPLIDVVFVVLILFILVAPLLDIDRISLATASEEGKKIKASIEENVPIKLHVFSDNTVWINNTLVPGDQLYTHLKHLKEFSPTAIPQLFHDQEAFFGTYQTVKNALEAAGFEELDVILKPGP